MKKDNGKVKSTSTDQETRVVKDGMKNLRAGSSITGNYRSHNCGFRTAGLGSLNERRASLQP